MITTPFDLIAIDLDGTLVDSVEDLHFAVTKMQQKMDRKISTKTEVRNWVGSGIERLVHRALTNSMDGDAIATLFDMGMPLFEEAYAQCNGSYSGLFPGVVEGLQWLARLDTPMVVVTNKARRFAEPLIKALQIDGYIDCLVAGDDVAEKKPHPAALLEAARRYMAVPAHSVLIGDSISDIKAARAARFTSISVSYGYNHGVPINVGAGQLSSDAVIDSFDELPKVFQRLAFSV
ncbi:MAG: phosphoglycolate phosphatase [Granulosicoccaceae bacterium]